jgi:type IV pilus assembly protein PilF
MENIIYMKKLLLPRLSTFSALWSVIFALLLFSCATSPANRGEYEFDTHYKFGLAHMSKGDLSKAYIEFQKVMKLDPKHKESLNYLGYISSRFNKYDEAESYYKRAISVDRHYSEALNNLGVFYLETEDWDEAIRYFEMALNNSVYNTPEKAYSNMGFAFLKKEDYISSQDAINSALMRKPDYSSAIYFQGLIFTKLHDDDAAIKNFLMRISIMPDHFEAHWELANAYVRIGERDKAVEHFKIVADNGNEKIANEAIEYIELLSR